MTARSSSVAESFASAGGGGSGPARVKPVCDPDKPMRDDEPLARVEQRILGLGHVDARGLDGRAVRGEIHVGQIARAVELLGRRITGLERGERAGAQVEHRLPRLDLVKRDARAISRVEHLPRDAHPRGREIRLRRAFAQGDEDERRDVVLEPDIGLERLRRILRRAQRNLDLRVRQEPRLHELAARDAELVHRGAQVPIHEQRELHRRFRVEGFFEDRGDLFFIHLSRIAGGRKDGRARLWQ